MPDLDFKLRLIKALNSGKRRGYSEVREVHGITCWIDFAIKIEKGVYMTYFYSVEEEHIAVAEDYEREYIESFEDLDSALQNLKSRGAQLEKLTGMRCSIPF